MRQMDMVSCFDSRILERTIMFLEIQEQPKFTCFMTTLDLILLLCGP